MGHFLCSKIITQKLKVDHMGLLKTFEAQGYARHAVHFSSHHSWWILIPRVTRALAYRWYSAESHFIFMQFWHATSTLDHFWTSTHTLLLYFIILLLLDNRFRPLYPWLDMMSYCPQTQELKWVRFKIKSLSNHSIKADKEEVTITPSNTIKAMKHSTHQTTKYSENLQSMISICFGFNHSHSKHIEEKFS